MLKLFKRSRQVTPVFKSLQADMHSHLLPGIDDGSVNMETSLHLLKGMQALGFSRVITTPHIMWDMYKNERDLILRKAEAFSKAASAAGIEMEISAAAEYFLDDHVAELLKKKEPLLTFGEKYLLVEFSFVSQPFDLRERLFDIQMAGYQPVIAHPERYGYFQNQKEYFDELRDAGYYFQANLLSFAGYYGRGSAEAATWLARKGYYDFVGTDLHNQRYLDELPNAANNTVFKKLLESGKLKNASL